ncbi:uncharacterized protein LOC131652809 isoform X2 [Vicia villosa]|uniref:uncharacterized protein LOC131652809 isoform X2 n=1 Tax=Vicia villosa TaxID=3911 RepID=UPI00273C44D5|nr:uncharacterized protein LOC131652809 isoform X2 [Vicia villosa]
MNFSGSHNVKHPQILCCRSVLRLCCRYVLPLRCCCVLGLLYAGTSWDELKHIRQAVGFLLLQEPGSYVGEVVKAIDKNKVLVKVCIGSSSCSVNTYTKRIFPGGGENISEGRDIAPAPVQPFHPKIKIRRGVLAAECADVMQQFFQLRRKNKKEEVLKEPSCLPVTHHHPAKLLNKIHDIIHVIFCL